MSNNFANSQRSRSILCSDLSYPTYQDAWDYKPKNQYQDKSKLSFPPCLAWVTTSWHWMLHNVLSSNKEVPASIGVVNDIALSHLNLMQSIYQITIVGACIDNFEKPTHFCLGSSNPFFWTCIPLYCQSKSDSTIRRTMSQTYDVRPFSSQC